MIIHDGAKITYSFIWETHKIDLVPSQDTVILTLATQLFTLSTNTNFNFSLLLFNVCYWIAFWGNSICYCSNYSKNSPHMFTIYVFDSCFLNFPNIFPAELLDGLPPLCDIQHQIDLVSVQHCQIGHTIIWSLLSMKSYVVKWRIFCVKAHQWKS